MNSVLWFLNEAWPLAAGFLVGWLAVKFTRKGGKSKDVSK